MSQIRFFTPESYRANQLKQQNKKEISYEDTVSINSQKHCYIGNRILKEKNVPLEYVDISTSSGAINLVFHSGIDSIGNDLYVKKLSPKYNYGASRSIRGYYFSVSSVLTNMGILSIKKLVRLPFFWLGNVMCIDIRSLLL